MRSALTLFINRITHPRIVFLCTAVCLLFNPYANCLAKEQPSLGGETDPSTLMIRWVQSTLSLENYKAVWILENEVVDPEGNVIDRFDSKETGVYRWPNSYEFEQASINKGDRFDMMRATQHNRVARIDARGNYTQRMPYEKEDKFLGIDYTLRKITTQEAHRAPHLLGLWLNEHRDLLSEAVVDPLDGSVSLQVDPLRLRFTITPTSSNPEHPNPAVRSIELLDDSASPALWWEYSDYREIANTGYHTGFSRIQYSFSNSGLYESPLAILEEAELLPNLPQGSSNPNANATADASAELPIGTGSSADQGTSDSISRSSARPSGSRLLIWSIPATAVFLAVITLWLVKTRATT